MKRILIYLFLAVFFLLSYKKESENPVIKQMSVVRGYKNWHIKNFRCGLFIPSSLGFATRADAAKDNRVWYCRIYRNGVIITDVNNDRDSYKDSPAYGPAAYEYKITVVNFYFKESVPSQPITITLTRAKGRRFNLNL